MKYFIISLIIVEFLTASEIPDKAKIDDGTSDSKISYENLLSPMVIDSSGNGYTLWTQMHECIGYNSIVDGIQVVNRAYPNSGRLNVHQTPGDLSYWVHDLGVYFEEFGPARYPSSIAGNDPYISFPHLINGVWGGDAAVYEPGGWFSSFWDASVDIFIESTHKVIGRELPDGNILFIGVTYLNEIRYLTMSVDLNTLVAEGSVINGPYEYWGFDFNNGIAHVFYYDTTNLNVLYKTTIDGINWSNEQSYNIIWPNPYSNNKVTWTQMALTDAGNPLLVFDNVNADDTTYPYYSKIYVSFASGEPCIEVSSTFAAPDTECYYPTIATGGNMAAVLYCMPRNNEPDSLNWWDFYVVWSTDNGITWETPQNITAELVTRPGLPQLAKRIDTLRNRVYYVYETDMVINHDPMWVVWSGPLDPMYICFDHTSYVGIEEEENNSINPPVQFIEISPNPFSQLTKISFCIGCNQEVDSRRKSVVSMKIYDASGRLVRQFDGRTMKLSDQITWQGDNDSGHKLPAGIYFIQLENRNLLLIKKIVKLE